MDSNRPGGNCGNRPSTVCLHFKNQTIAYCTNFQNEKNDKNAHQFYRFDS